MCSISIELKIDTLKCFQFTGIKTEAGQWHQRENTAHTGQGAQQQYTHLEGRLSPAVSMTSCKQINMSRMSRFCRFSY